MRKGKCLVNDASVFHILDLVLQFLEPERHFLSFLIDEINSEINHFASFQLCLKNLHSSKKPICALSNWVEPYLMGTIKGNVCEQ